MIRIQNLNAKNVSGFSVPNEKGSQDLLYQFEIGNKLLPTTALMTTESDSVKTLAKEFQF